MKIWMYYLPEYLSRNRVWDRNKLEELDKKKEYVLYAMTPEKSVAKRFEKIRDMKLFRRLITNMTKEEYQKLAKEHRDCVLEDAELLTIIGYPKEKNKLNECFQKYKIALTWFESSAVDDIACDAVRILEEYFGVELPDVNIFSTDLKRALCALGYDAFLYSQVLDGTSHRHCSSEMLSRVSDDAMELHQTLSSDELEIFIMCYGHLLNPELSGKYDK